MSSEDAQVAKNEENEADDGTGAEEGAESQEDAVKESKVESKEESKDESGSDSGLPDDPKVLKQEVEKLRRENAARRVKSKEIEEAAQKWQEHLDAQKTEAEKMQEQLEGLRQENQKLQRQQMQRDVAKEYGVDDDLVEFIDGADLDEMKQKAEKLAAKTSSKKKSGSASELRAGRSSPPPKVTGSSWLKDIMLGDQ